MPNTDICPRCGHTLYIGSWPFCSPDGSPHAFTPRQFHSVHKSERAVVYQHPVTGKVVYPPRNDLPMPDRYRKAGYERREMSTLHSLQCFEKEQPGVISMINHYNTGTGRDYFDEHEPPDLPQDCKDDILSGRITVGVEEVG